MLPGSVCLSAAELIYLEILEQERVLKVLLCPENRQTFALHDF